MHSRSIRSGALSLCAQRELEGDAAYGTGMHAYACERDTASCFAQARWGSRWRAWLHHCRSALDESHQSRASKLLRATK